MFKIQKRVWAPSKHASKKKFLLREAKTQPVMAKDVYAEIERINTLTSSDMKAFMDALEVEVTKLLLDNSSVQLGDLGTLSCTVRNKPKSGKTRYEDVNVRDCLGGLVVRFTASPELKKTLQKGQGIQFLMVEGDEGMA